MERRSDAFAITATQVSTWPAPLHLDLNVTNGCNLSCAHCHASSGDRLLGELTTDEFLGVVTDLHEAGVLGLAIAGGEPFVRPDIVDVLEHACALSGWSVSVITNGTALPARRVTDLERRCPGLGVNVSLDGSTPARMSVLRSPRRGSLDAAGRLHDRVLTSIRTLADSTLKCAVNFTLTRTQLEDLEAVYSLVIDGLGVDGLIGIKFFAGGHGRAHLDELEIPYPAWSAFFSSLTRRRLDGALPALRISVAAPWEFYLPLVEADIDITAAEHAWQYRSPLRNESYAMYSDAGDPAGVVTAAVSADGSVYPSVLLDGSRDAYCGNLRHSPFDYLWQHSSVLHRLRQRTTEVGVASGCEACPLVTICGGGSRARSVTVGRGLDAGDPLCPILGSQNVVHA